MITTLTAFISTFLGTEPLITVLFNYMVNICEISHKDDTNICKP